MKTISVYELKKKLQEDGNFILIDVREPDELNKGAIPGAQNIPVGKIEEEVEALKKYDVAYINCGRVQVCISRSNLEAEIFIRYIV